MRHVWRLAGASFSAGLLLLVACANPLPAVPAPHPAPAASLPTQLSKLLPADALLLGEQHDAPEHQRIHQQVMQALAGQGQLAALVLEMAPQGGSTRGLPAQASESDIQTALLWDESAWQWAVYGPAIVSAVRAGVPVLGTNLPTPGLRATMRDTSLDQRLVASALAEQQQRIRSGHCDMLPESQIAPMARVQIARDLAMAQTITDAAQAGRTVVLLAGHGHVAPSLGVPQHLPPTFKAKAVLLLASQGDAAMESVANFDAVWSTGPIPPRDYCAEFKVTRKP
ncbi:MAG: ChaN family lipoprotein [Betaproteobacteria bacterium]